MLTAERMKNLADASDEENSNSAYEHLSNEEAANNSYCTIL